MAELNLIPQSMKANKQKNHNVKMAILSVIIVLSFLFFGAFIPYYYLEQLKLEESELQMEVAAQYSIMEERNLKEAQIANMNEFVATVDSFGMDKPLLNEYIVALQLLVPKDIICTSLTYTASSISVTGVAQNYESPSIFVANLQETDTFANASLLSIADSEAGYVFSITILLVK